MKIYAPDGNAALETQPPVPLPASLEGQRVAVLDNGKPGAAALMERAVATLADSQGVRAAGVFRKGSAATPCEPDLLEEILQAADLVLTGTAD